MISSIMRDTSHTRPHLLPHQPDHLGHHGRVAACRTRLSRRALLRRTGIVLSACALAACASLMGPRTVDISSNELLSKFSKQFPLTKRVLGMFDVTATTPRLNMMADTNRVAADVDLGAKDIFSNKNYLGTVGVSFGLRFEPQDQTLRLMQLKIEHIHIEGMPASFQQMLVDLGTKISNEQFQDFPIHHFKPEDLRSADRMGYQVADIQVTQTGLAVHLVPKP